jgi:hypothetical protein
LEYLEAKTRTTATTTAKSRSLRDDNKRTGNDNSKSNDNTKSRSLRDDNKRTGNDNSSDSNSSDGNSRGGSDWRTFG